MAQCPVCDHHNRSGVLFCEECGEDLYDSLMEIIATKKLPIEEKRKMFTDRQESMCKPPIVLHIRGANTPLPVECKGRLTIGRQNPKQPDDQPEVDLAPFGADEQGVSRRHAAIETSSEPPLLFDLGSANGTFVNGQKLIPNRAHPLKSGDEVRLGRMVMQVYYKTTVSS